jgi:signal transduction histidine kinase
MRPRVVRAIVGSVLVTLVLFGLPLGWVVERSYRNDLRLRLETAALGVAPELTTAPLPLTADEAPAQNGAIRVAYYDTTGRLLAGRGPVTGDAVVTAALRGTGAHSLHVVAVPVARDEHVVGVVRAEEPAALLTGRIHRAWALMALLGVAILAAVAGLAVALVRRLTGPVHRLAAAARRLEAGDFAVAPEPSGIEEIDTAGVAMAAAARRLEAVLARERALTADVTHQLRTPLTALRIELEAGADRPEGPSATRSLAQVDRIESTITSMLALARDVGADRAPVDLGPLVASTCREWSRTVRAAGRMLHLRSERGPTIARVSPLALHQILDVLLDNALVHGQGAIVVTCRAISGGTEVTVRDDGTPEIDPEVIFRRRSASSRGHGIGLALARSLAEAEGGRLRLLVGEPTTAFSLVFLAEGEAAATRSVSEAAADRRQLLAQNAGMAE